LSAQASQRDVSSVRLCGELAGAVRGVLGCESETPTVKVVDTTSDTTQSATPRNSERPPAKKSVYLSRFCNIWQRPETGVIGLWLRRSRVRVPSVTLLCAGKTRGINVSSHTRSGSGLPESTMARRTLTTASRANPATKKATSERSALR
jgi:hypothetical protein